MSAFAMKSNCFSLDFRLYLKREKTHWIRKKKKGIANNNKSIMRECSKYKSHYTLMFGCIHWISQRLWRNDYYKIIIQVCAFSNNWLAGLLQYHCALFRLNWMDVKLVVSRQKIKLTRKSIVFLSIPAQLK